LKGIELKPGFKWLWAITFLVIASFALAACGDSTSTNTPFPAAQPTKAPAATGAAGAATTAAAASGVPPVDGTPVKTASGLQYIDTKVGEGPAAQAGQKVSVHYTGYLTNGKKFDSSLDRGQPFPLTLGAGQVIKGWDEGLVGMKAGGKRRLIIPPALGYGASGSPPVIPANADLIFDVEMVKIG
jgi:peptidylprolyl isomerase